MGPAFFPLPHPTPLHTSSFFFVCIQEYYANTGALKRAAQTARGGKAVGCSIVEAYGKVYHYEEFDWTLTFMSRAREKPLHMSAVMVLTSPLSPAGRQAPRARGGSEARVPQQAAQS